MQRRTACLLLASAPLAITDALRAASPASRPWLGAEFWSNPLQDWQLRDGRFECIGSGGDRNVYLLTRELSAGKQPFSTRVSMGRLAGDNSPLDDGFVGFRVGIRGHLNNYRDSAIYGWGLNAGITTKGHLVIGSPVAGGEVRELPTEMQLVLDGQPDGNEFALSLSVMDRSGRVIASTRRSVPAAWVEGGVALVCSHGPLRPSPDPASVQRGYNGFSVPNRERGGNVRFWFRDWSVSGPKVQSHNDRTFGPILWTMYTVSRGVMKLSAQMPPVHTSGPVRLQVKSGSSWKTIGTASIDHSSCNAAFRVPDWDAIRDVEYRVTCDIDGPHEFTGVIRRDPVDKPKFVLAALSCLNDFGFPHEDLLHSIAHFQPDLLAFEGDQIYERAGSYGVQPSPLKNATLDYLRKWFLFGWSFRDLMRSTPSICMADDHDVFQGNVWGAGGRHAEGFGIPAQDQGGYVEPAAWVNMMQRTQTSHLPDPVDPTPVLQNIGVYYTHLCWGGVSFAVLEDRKWKSAPKEMLPHAKIVNGWAQNPQYNAARDGNVPGAELLGPRQLEFLNAWAQDWKGGIWMKAVLSQTLFANLATLPKSATSDDVVPSMPILKPDAFPTDDKIVSDHDSNGWPQRGRDEAIRAFRRCSAFHVCGDQHLGSTVQYGVDDWKDGAFALCSPALSNIFPRRWYPPQPGRNADPAFPKNSGDFIDGFGNHVTVHAVFNPSQHGAEPNLLLDRSPGFGIVEMDRATRNITFSVWARGTDVRQPGARPVDGWPITIAPLDNGWSKCAFALDVTTLVERPDLCVQVVDERDSELLYTTRIQGRTFTAPVRRAGRYTVRFFDPDGTYGKTVRHVEARKAG